MNKKIIIGIIAAVVVIGGTVGTVLGVQAYNTNKEYEQLAQNVADCENKINTMNYVYYEDTNGVGENARKAELEKLNGYKEKIEAKDMSDEEKTEFADFSQSVKKHFEDDKTETKTQFDAAQASKDSHTDEGYYSDEFNNEWNSFVNQFNDNYGKEQYLEAFKVVLTMQGKLNEYVAGKEQEAQARAQAEAEQAAAAAQVKNSADSKKSSSSGKKSSGLSSGDNSGSDEGKAGGGDTGYRGYSSYEEWYAKAPSWEEGSARNQMVNGQENFENWINSIGGRVVEFKQQV